MKKLSLIILLATMLVSCGAKIKPSAELLDSMAFDTVIDGKKVSLYTLTNANGMAVQVTNYGARVVSLWVEARQGEMKDVVWGYGSIKDYLNATDVYAGPVVGRYGNRINKGVFSIDGKEYRLPINNGENHLHGGPQGWSTKVWSVDERGRDSLKREFVTLSYVSPGGEQGYPGQVNISVRYTLTADNGLQMDYMATTDSTTIINPTNHSYFNLHGSTTSSTNSHILMIAADSYTPTDSGLIPTGDIASVEGTPLDFTTPTVIGERIDADFTALSYGKGYDHNWVLKKSGESSFEFAAELYEPSTGVVMSIFTDQVGLQFYSGNFMTGIDRDKRGDKHDFRTGIALEAQNFPDAPNHANFPSAILTPEDVYTQKTLYKFSVR